MCQFRKLVWPHGHLGFESLPLRQIGWAAAPPGRFGVRGCLCRPGGPAMAPGFRTSSRCSPRGARLAAIPSAGRYRTYRRDCSRSTCESPLWRSEEAQWEAETNKMKKAGHKTADNDNAEGCRSGRTGALGKRVCGKPYLGFESLPLRHMPVSSERRRDAGAVERARLESACAGNRT